MDNTEPTLGIGIYPDWTRTADNRDWPIFANHPGIQEFIYIP